jgi:hypothetical protein
LSAVIALNSAHRARASPLPRREADALPPRRTWRIARCSQIRIWRIGDVKCAYSASASPKRTGLIVDRKRERAQDQRLHERALGAIRDLRNDGADAWLDAVHTAELHAERVEELAQRGDARARVHRAVDSRHVMAAQE